MRRFSLPNPVTALALALLLSACARDPIKDAIKRLGGPPAETRRAAMELRLSSRDPIPQLVEAIRDKRASRRVRLEALTVLGEIAKRQHDERALAFIVEMLADEDPAFRKSAMQGLVGTHFEPAVAPLIALKKDADKETLRLIDDALRSTAEYLVEEVEKLWNSPEAAMAEYARAEALGLDRGVMGYSKACYLEARGQAAEAEQKFRELGMVRRWWIIGPFPNRQGMGFDRVYPPEKEIDLNASYVAGYGDAEWYRMDRDLPSAKLDFENYFVEVDNVVGYGLIFLISDREQEVEVRAGSDDTITILLNGEIVWSHEQYRGAKFDDDIVDVTLRKGPNALLCKVCEDWGAWQLIGRITGIGDTPLEGVVITDEPPEEAVPWERP